MARPKLQVQDRRSKKINFRVSVEEDRQIAERTRKARCGFSAFALEMLIYGPLKMRKENLLSYTVVHELMRINTNLKQLKQIPDSAEQNHAISRLHERIFRIISSVMDHTIMGGGYGSEPYRGKVLCVRVTESQKAIIEARAKQAGKFLSEYARKMLTKGRVITRQPYIQNFVEFPELKELGVLLNTKTRKANAIQEIPHGLSPILGRIDEILDVLSREYRLALEKKKISPVEAF